MSMLHKFFINSKMFKSQKINSLLMVCPTRSSREYRYATLQPLCYIFSGIFFLFQTLMYYSLFTVHWDTPLGHVAACCLAMHCFLPSFQFPQFTLLCSYCVQFVPQITNYVSLKPEVCYSVNEDEWSFIWLRKFIWLWNIFVQILSCVTFLILVCPLASTKKIEAV